jgi:uncharacterized protein (TIGR02147 family)
MENSVNKPNIYSYFNYREYLSALFNYNKALSPVFSHRYIVGKAGYKSPNSLKIVINGERHLSLEGAERFATAFKLEEKERRFFVLMVKFNTTESQQEKEVCFNELLNLRKSCSAALLKDEQIEILSRWYHVAVREITALPDFRNSSLWISRILTPPITHSEAAQSLRLLKKMGFIKKTERGYEPVEQVIQSDPELYHVYASMFHREMIRLGMESISRFPHEVREISGTTLRISKSDVTRVKNCFRISESSFWILPRAVRIRIRYIR